MCGLMLDIMIAKLANHIREPVYDLAMDKLSSGWNYGDVFQLLEECEIEADKEEL